ncbi:MAG: hypothetical protein PWP14_2090 [Methanolobus sp.]|nr:hypothetical protein [Methanolobus sp.]
MDLWAFQKTIEMLKHIIFANHIINLHPVLIFKAHLFERDILMTEVHHNTIGISKVNRCWKFLLHKGYISTIYKLLFSFSELSN